MDMIVTIWMILALLCLIYGGIVHAAGGGTWFFLVWIAIAVGFVGVALIVKNGIWGNLPEILRQSVIGCVIAGLVFLVVIEGFVVSGFGEEGEPGLDYLIVLGAQVYEDGPCLVLQYRLDKAADYLEKNPHTQCIVSGGMGINEPRVEAEVMAEYLMEKRGIAPDRIQLEKQSTSTAENIRFSRLLMPKESSVGLVSNNFHMFRALKIAKKQGLGRVCGISAYSTPLYLPNNMFREFFALVKYCFMK